MKLRRNVLYFVDIDSKWLNIQRTKERYSILNILRSHWPYVANRYLISNKLKLF